jgi:hypothetical protein
MAVAGEDLVTGKWDKSDVKGTRSFSSYSGKLEGKRE